ncbi:MAG TPA: hypothetical protein VF921_17955 [Vicinamibacterales bacterium]
MTRITSARFAALLFGGLLLAGSAGCGKGILTAPTVVTPAQIARLGGHIALGGDVFEDLAVQRDGTLTAILTWTFSNNLDITLTEASCGTRDFYGCTILASSRAPRGTYSERLIAAVRAGRTLRFWITNMDDAASASYTLDVVIQ